jgi:hypothetical protein
VCRYWVSVTLRIPTLMGAGSAIVCPRGLAGAATEPTNAVSSAGPRKAAYAECLFVDKVDSPNQCAAL